MDVQKLLTAVPSTNRELATPYLNQLAGIVDRYHLNTPLRQAHFLAQVAHESGWFRFSEENLNYSAKALRGVFGKYFRDEGTAEDYARKPEKIANRVYANRMNNGNEASGDGWRYRGRGLIQLTGKANYQAYTKDRGVDFVANPAMVSEPEWALDSAAWFWDKRGLNKYADQDNILVITKRINGGTNGLAHRQACLAAFKKALGI